MVEVGRFQETKNMNHPTRRSLIAGSWMPLAGVLGLPSISEAAQAASSAYRRPKLKITEIRTAEVRVHGYQVHVRVYTDQGIIGQGESTDAARRATCRSYGRSRGSW
jgi:hypothetical protein